MSQIDPDVDFIFRNAERLINVTAGCVISFGLAAGLADAADANPHDPGHDWSQALYGFHGDTILMAALRVSLLLDRDEKVVSFQAVHRRLKLYRVRKGLLRAVASRRGPDIFGPPSRADLIREFFRTYAEIDWQVHGRLTHFRNRGIAHLTPQLLAKSITVDELQTLVALIGRLATTLQHLCQTKTAFRDNMLVEYRRIARNAMKPIRTKVAMSGGD
ncbi:hypothetical protein AAFX91_37875 [Bradyrhizobium sp. 31Argb]|uniref:hypothetical protein n=1 Tax=unclassified Bradyrhizobium TaxID=2631580 RepID=UPI00102E687D|nr:hypothetical protein [Bradyrhizobium sp. Leo170]